MFGKLNSLIAPLFVQPINCNLFFKIHGEQTEKIRKWLLSKAFSTNPAQQSQHGAQKNLRRPVLNLQNPFFKYRFPL